MRRSVVYFAPFSGNSERSKTMSDRKYHIETLAVHAGQGVHGDPAT